MKKKYLLLTAGLMVAAGLSAQTLNVNIGEVTYAHQAAQTGDMVYTDGTTLTIQGKVYNLGEIDNITINQTEVPDNTVSVEYNGSSAHVVVAGNLASRLDVQSTGADVSVVAGLDVTEEIVYTLSGSSTDGSFYMDGEAKASLVLNALNLTNADGGVITIDNGKRIAVTVKGNNVLADGADGQQKACMFINGHVELDGSGTLTLTGNTKHAYFSDEYTHIMPGFGKLTVTGAVGDGIHVNQYLRIDGGNLTVNSVGDGIDVGANLKGEEYDGQLFINGGTIKVNVTGSAAKGIKADTDMTITDGDVDVKTTGDAYYDAAEADITSSSAMKPDGAFKMEGGKVKLMSTGASGKGLNVTNDITISGGSMEIVTTGVVYKYGTLDSKPHGMKTDNNITIDGGTVIVAASPTKGTAFKADLDLTINGGQVLGFGGKESVPTGGTQNYSTSSGVNVAGGSELNYNGIIYSVPSEYNNSSAYVLVSTPDM